MNKIACMLCIGICLMGIGCRSFVSKLYGIPKKEVTYVYPSLRTIDITINDDDVQWMDNRFNKAEALTVYSCNSKTNECIATPYVDESTHKVALARLVPYMPNLIQILNFKSMFPENDIARIKFTEQSIVR